MPAYSAFSRRWPTVLAVVSLAVLLVSPTPAQDTKASKLAEPIATGQRVFTCGHSFHVWVPGIVSDLCKKAGIPNHTQLGVSSIGGSRTIQHWDLPEGKNKAKDAL